VESISLFRKIAAVVTFFAMCFLLASIWSFSAADPPGTHVYLPGETVHNWCGTVGAYVAHALFWAIGDAAYPLILFLAAAVFLWLSHKGIDDAAFRVIGALLLMATVATASAMIEVEARLPIGNGGVLGLAAWDFLRPRLGTIGTVLMLVPVALVGLLLLTDTWFILLPIMIAKWVWKRARDPSRHLATVAAAGAAAAGAAGLRLFGGGGTAVADEEETDEDEAQPTVRKVRKPRRQADDKEEEVEEPDADRPKRQRSRKAARDADDEAEAEAAAEVEEEADEPEAAPPAPAPLPRNVIIRTSRPAPKAEEAEALPEDFSFTPLASTPRNQEYHLPTMDLLDEAEYSEDENQESHIRSQAETLTKTLAEFGVQAEVVACETGPVITQYEVALAPGIKVGKVIGLSDDIAISMKASSVRIVAPLPGRDTIGVEVPNLSRQIVRLKEILLGGRDDAQRMSLPLFLGKDATGQALVKDLANMPHLLIAGTTGSGKSICLNSIIMSLLLTRTPDDLKLVLIDPKMVEMTVYNRLPHLLCPVVNDMRKAEAILSWLVDKMEERYVTLSKAGVRNIASYNRLTREEIVEKFQPTSPEEEAKLPYHLPHICVIVDELADLMMVAAKEGESHVTRLAQKSRAVGIHLVMATQRPSVDVLTGLIKSNLPIRISFQVATRVDSRTILDSMGAEKLLGQGDMLVMTPGAHKFVRAQGAFVSDQDIQRVIDFVTQEAEPAFQRELIQIRPKGEDGDEAAAGGIGDDESLLAVGADDEMYNQAIEIVLEHQRGSVSLLQRRLGIGYGRAARLIDQMAEDGIVGEYKGSQAREVVLTLEQWHALKQQRRPDEVPESKPEPLTDDEAALDT